MTDAQYIAILTRAVANHERAVRTFLAEAADCERAGDHQKADAAGVEAAGHLRRAMDCALAAECLQ
jgi:hypothetical protein